MTDNQVGFVCMTLVAVAWLALWALRIWIDHKEEMRKKP